MLAAILGLPFWAVLLIVLIVVATVLVLAAVVMGGQADDRIESVDRRMVALGERSRRDVERRRIDEALARMGEDADNVFPLERPRPADVIPLRRESAREAMESDGLGA